MTPPLVDRVLAIGGIFARGGVTACSVRVSSGEIQTFESAGRADISQQTASFGGTKRQIRTTRSVLVSKNRPGFVAIRARGGGVV